MPPKRRDQHLKQLKLARTTATATNVHAAAITGTADDDDDDDDDDDHDDADDGHDDEVAVSVAARESASRRSSFGVVVDDDDDDDDTDAVPDTGDMSVDETGAGVLSANTVFVFAHRATRSHDGSQGTPDPTRAVRSGILSQTSAFASPQSSAPATPAIKRRVRFAADAAAEPRSRQSDSSQSLSAFCDDEHLSIGDIMAQLDIKLPELPVWSTALSVPVDKNETVARWAFAFEYSLEQLAGTVMFGGVVVNVGVRRGRAGAAAADGNANADNSWHAAEFSGRARARRRGAEATVVPGGDGDGGDDGDDSGGADGDSDDGDDAAAAEDDDDNDDGELSLSIPEPARCRNVDERLVLPVRRNCKYCGALYFTAGGISGFNGTLGNYICCAKGTQIAKAPAPPVRDLPQPLRDVVLSDRFPSLARWINGEVAMANFYFKGNVNNNAHGVDGNHAVTVRGPFSVRVANEATNGGIRFVLYAEPPVRAGAAPRVQDMAGGAQRVRRVDAAARSLSAADAAFVRHAADILRPFLREKNALAVQFVAAAQVEHPGDRAVVTIELQADALPAAGRSEVSLMIRTLNMSALPSGRRPNAMVFRLPMQGEALVANEAAGQREYVSMTSGLFDPLSFTLYYLNGELGWYRVRRGVGGAAAAAQLAAVEDEDPADDGDDRDYVRTLSTTGSEMILPRYVRSIALHLSKHVAAPEPVAPEPVPAQPRSRASSRSRAPSRRRLEADESAALEQQVRSRARAAPVVTWERTLIQLAGRGLQEFACVEFFRMEQQRLSYLAWQQKEARDAKKPVRLPAVHTQSPRWYAEKRDGTMTMVVRLGKPTLFVTFTCNPRWVEIVRELREGEDAADQPFLVNQVFKAKLTILLKMVTNGEIFGSVAVYVVSVTEFQKRGMPHAHILLRLADSRATADYIDSLVTVTKPPADTADCALVEELMEHNCNTRSVCRDANDKCKRGFPKQAQVATTIDAQGFPHYKRDARSARIVAYNLKLLRYFGSHLNVEFCGSNAVVGYLLQYAFKGVDRQLVRQVQQQSREQHGYVDEIAEYQQLRVVGSMEAAWRILRHEIVLASVAVTSFGAHLPDEAPRFLGGQVQGEDGDEPRNTLSHVERYFARPIGALFDEMLILDFTERWLHIGQLRQNDVLDATAFWDSAQPPAKAWLWGARKGLHAARMFTLNHTAGEKYYIRLLLLNVAARSFEQLRQTTDATGVVTEHETFAKAAAARGLIDDRSGEYARSMQDAIDAAATPQQLRRLFVALVSNGAFASGGTGAQVLLDAPLRAAAAGESTMVRHALQYDYYTTNLKDLTGNDASLATVQNKTDSRDAAGAALIRELHRLFEARGFVGFVEKFGVPPLPAVGVADALDADIEEQRILRIERERWAARAIVERAADKTKLTGEQAAVFAEVCRRVENAGVAALDVGLFVLCASAGCGKTFVANLLMEELRAQRRIVIVVATSGIAATMLPGGTTVHRRFGIPIEDRVGAMRAGAGTTLDGIDVTDVRPLQSHLPPDHQNRVLSKHAGLLIWDEAFSATKSLFKSVDCFLQQVRGCDLPMGGLPTLLIGDPRQIPPIIPGTLAQSAVKQESLQAWLAGKSTRMFVLTRSMRQSADPNFAALLKQVGDGLAGDEVPGAVTHRRLDLPQMTTFRGREEFLSHVFLDVNDSEACVNRAVICARNDEVLAWNNLAIDRLPGAPSRLIAATQLADFVDPGEGRRGVPIEHSVFTDEYLATVLPSGVPPHVLTLKPGTIAILIMNLAPDDGLTNGTKIIIDRIVSPVLLQVRARNPSTGVLTQAYIPRMRFNFNLHRTSTAVVRTQFPVLPAYAITCNRAQCQTLDFVGFDATVPIFSHGSLFVALSRARRAVDVAIFVGSDGRALGADGAASVVNVVYPELIRDALAATARQQEEAARHVVDPLF